MKTTVVDKQVPQWAIDAAIEWVDAIGDNMASGLYALTGTINVRGEVQISLSAATLAAIIAKYAPMEYGEPCLTQLLREADARIAELEAENERLVLALRQCETMNGAFCHSNPSIDSMNRRLDEINSIVFAAVIQRQR